MRRRLGALIAGGLRFRGYTPSWVAGQVALAGVMSFAASLVLNLVLAPGGVYLSFGQLWLLLTAALLVQWIGHAMLEPPSFTDLWPDAPEADEPRSRPYSWARRWELRLSATSGDPERFGPVVRDRLAALVLERLRQRRGIRSLEQARPVLGDELYRLLAEPAIGTPSPSDLDRLITRMERI